MATFPSFLLLIATAFGIGRVCLLRVRFVRAAEVFVFSSALGMAILCYAMLLLGAVGAMTPLVVLVVFAAASLVSIPVCARFVSTIRWRSIRLDFLSAVCLAVLAGAAILNGIVAANPILEVDAYDYHVSVPKAWLLAGRIFPIPYCLQSNYHLLPDMINVVALSLSHNDVVLCKLLQWYSGVLLAAATWCFGRSFFSARVAWVAAALTYMVKEVSWVSGDGYVDLTVGLYVWLGLFAMVRAAHLRGGTWHALAGLFFGLGFASKQSGAMFVAMAYAAYGIVLLLDPRRRPQLRRWPARAVLAGAIAALLAGPWMAKNYLHTGDPFFPLLARSFNVPEEFARPASFFTGFYGGLSRYFVWDRQTLPQLLRAFHNFRNNVMYTGANVLVVWLLASALLLIAFRCRATLALRLLLAVGLIAAPWFAWVTSRFLFGFFPVYLLVLAETLRRVTNRRRIAFALLAGLLLFFYARTLVGYDLYGHPVAPLDRTRGPILSAPAREKWLLANNGAYAIVRRANRFLLPADRVLACGGTQAVPWLDIPFLPNPDVNLPDMLWKRFGDAAAMRRWLDEQGITHLLLAGDLAMRLERESGFVHDQLERLSGTPSLALYRLR